MEWGKLLLGAALETGAITLACEAKDRASKVVNGSTDNAIKDGAIAAACGVSAIVVGKEGLTHLSGAFNDKTQAIPVEVDSEPEIPVLDGEFEFDEVPVTDLEM